MNKSSQMEPVIIVLFGASGDLSARKVIPALYNLHLDGLLPAQYAIVGVARSALTEETLRGRFRQGVDQYSRRGPAKEQEWAAFAEHLHYIQSSYDEPTLYDRLTKLGDTGWETPPNIVFYLATPPNLFTIVIDQLGRFSELQGDIRYRIVIEKPFGHDLHSAKALNQRLLQVFEEKQIYRIDHYLGKETVQNILAFRFGNAMWEPIWNRNFIDHVQITVSEKIGIGRRGRYYDSAGALRDMIQNHLMQLLCLIAMEAPTEFTADQIRNKKVDVMHAIRAINKADVPAFAVRGQYGQGWLDGQPAQAYRCEKDVDINSNTETFAALKLFVDNWRWQGVPFYLRTGKCMPGRVSEISLQFRPVPHHPFAHLNTQVFQPNRLVLQIEPNEGVVLRTQAKEPGMGMKLKPVDMSYCYQDVFHQASPDAYETLLVDIMRNDPGLFMRADQVEAAWSVIDPILEVWSENTELNFPNYQAGQWGPPEAESLVAQDRRTWLLPISFEAKRGGCSVE